MQRSDRAPEARRGWSLRRAAPGGDARARSDVRAPATAASGTLLAFAGADGVPRRWRLLSGGAVVGRGDELAQLPDQRPWVRTVLAVPGTDVTIHWLELADTLTTAQAAAAARLQLAEESAEPIGDLHVAAGRRENGLTAIAVAPAERMRGWIAAAKDLGMEPDVIVPAPMLLMPPGEGLVRYEGDAGAPDYRGTARAFSLEDELAQVVLGDTHLTEIEEETRDAGLGPVLASPPVNLRQGAFARRRELVLDARRLNWLLTLGLILLIVSLLIQITMIVRTTFAADRYEAEAMEMRRALAAAGPSARRQPGGFGTATAALMDAVRETPAAQVSQLIYQPDGSLRVGILADSQATIDGLRARIEARGLQAAGGLPSTVGGRAAGDITVRPR